MKLELDGLTILSRPIKGSDWNFVRGTWLHGMTDRFNAPRSKSCKACAERKHLPAASQRPMERAKFCAWQHPIIDQHLELDDFRIACPEGSEDVILAWACARKGLPIYAYVVKNGSFDIRGKGLIRALFAELEIQPHEHEDIHSDTRIRRIS